MHWDGSKMTTDHRVIRRWVEKHGGRPAVVKDSCTTHEEAGVIRIFFPDEESGENLESITWDKFFEKFDQANLAFIYSDGELSADSNRFFKIVSQDGE
ncbi:1,4-alpha-glucan branching enzyme [Chitinispirillum alkaliphilum]|nr:1,4-alpha-glucan branching enzyme [Chitinispirillum alkaliphilum]